eukprot:SAG22_NODE_1215_length_5146_cov_1.556965_5_plen_171_part_00
MSKAVPFLAVYLSFLTLFFTGHKGMFAGLVSSLRGGGGGGGAGGERATAELENVGFYELHFLWDETAGVLYHDIGSAVGTIGGSSGGGGGGGGTQQQLAALMESPPFIDPASYGGCTAARCPYHRGGGTGAHDDESVPDIAAAHPEAAAKLRAVTGGKACPVPLAFHDEP